MIQNKSKLFLRLSSIDFELLAGLVLFLIAAQPLYGIFETVTSQQDLVALFYGKATVIRFIGICGLFVGLADFYVKRQKFGSAYTRKHLFKNPWNFLFLLFLVWSIITSLGAVNPSLSYFSYAYRYEGLLSYFAYAGVFMCGSIIKDKDRRRKILNFAIIVAAVVALATLAQENEDFFLKPLQRNGFVGAYSGTFINSNHYGYYLSVVLMLCAGRFYEAEKIREKIHYGFMFLLNTRVLLYNNSFGPFLAVSVALVAMFIVYTVRNGIENSVFYLIIIAIFFGLDALVNDAGMIKTYYSIFNEFLGLSKVVTEAAEGEVEAALSEHGTSGSGRLRIWLAAYDVWKQHIWTGCGPENVPMEMHEALGNYEATHNEYLQILAEMGVIGLVIYMSAQIAFFVRNIRTARETEASSLIAYGAVGCYLISALFGITITVSEVFFFFVLGIANGFQTEEPVKVSRIKTNTEANRAS